MPKPKVVATLPNASTKNCILTIAVIAGNPKVNRTMFATAVALLLLALLMTMTLARRKKVDPHHVPPLHAACFDITPETADPHIGMITAFLLG